ncbi:MAG: hypothetical protein DRJ10_04050 [Bacteroidetes bacterium]|nr:MAG: hypothetical protein DRJ10_04050 [Bacteroidota bacterium]
MRHILFVMFLFPLTLIGQHSTWIYGIQDDGESNYAYLVRMDYLTGQYDTLIEIDAQYIDYYSSCFDPFNGRYFFRGTLNSNEGNLHVIDINTLQLESYYTIEGAEIAYNFLNNSIIFQEDSTFWKYDIESGQAVAINSITPEDASIFGDVRYYNPIDNTYVYRAYFYDKKNHSPFIIIDAFTGETICVTPASVQLHSMFVDYQTGLQFGKHGETIYEFNPYSGSITNKLSIPNYQAHIISQMDVYDQIRNKYIVFYSATDNTSKVSIIDMDNFTIDTTYNQPNNAMGLQEIYCKPNSFLKLINDTLYTSFGSNYHWFYNDSIIPNNYEQTLAPEVEGKYQSLVEYPEYSSLSNPINYILTNDQTILRFDNFKIGPNPFSSSVQITNQVDGSDFKLFIHNSLGKVVYESITESTSEINLSFLPSGLYILSIEIDQKLFTRKKIIKSR